MIYCEDCGTVPVPEKDLPVQLPYDVQFAPDGNLHWLNVNHSSILLAHAVVNQLKENAIH
mgnify:CR=1 FL=1